MASHSRGGAIFDSQILKLSAPKTRNPPFQGGGPQAAEVVDGRADVLLLAAGLLVDLLPVGLLVGEVPAGLAAVLLHTGRPNLT